LIGFIIFEQEQNLYRHCRTQSLVAIDNLLNESTNT